MKVSSDFDYKKLLYRSLNRGCRENDILLGNFARANLEQLGEDELAEYQNLLDESDDDLFGWITGKLDIPARLQTSVLLQKIIQFSQSNKLI